MAQEILRAFGQGNLDAPYEEEAPPQPLLQLTDSNDEGVHLLFCGHQIHMECFDRYFSSLIKSHIDVRHRPLLQAMLFSHGVFLLLLLHHLLLITHQGNEYEGDNIINLEVLEFLCPVCRRLSNTLVPLVPDSHVGPALQPPAPVAATPPEFDGALSLHPCKKSLLHQSFHLANLI